MKTKWHRGRSVCTAGTCKTTADMKYSSGGERVLQEGWRTVDGEDVCSQCATTLKRATRKIGKTRFTFDPSKATVAKTYNLPFGTKGKGTRFTRTRFGNYRVSYGRVSAGYYEMPDIVLSKSDLKRHISYLQMMLNDG